MNKRISIALSAATMLIAGPQIVSAQTNLNTLTVYTAIEVQFPTEIGKLYTLQGAANLTNWTDIGQAIYGHGRVVDQIFSTKTIDTVSFTAYRLKVENGPTNGFAPWQMDSKWMVLDDGSSTNVVRYDDNSHGHDSYAQGADHFEYEYKRTGESEAEVERHYGTNREDRVTMSFTAPGEGTWVKEEFRDGALERRGMGRFHSSTNDPGTTPPPVVTPTPQPPAPPTALAGMKLHIRSGDLPVELKFLTTTNGVEEAGENRHGAHLPEIAFGYEYAALSSNTASLNLNFATNSFDGDRNEYDLTFTDGGSGTFVRRIVRLGSVVSTDSGVFGPDHNEIETGDDHGGHGGEVGADNGGSATTSAAPSTTVDNKGTAVEAGDDKVSVTEVADDKGATTVEPGDDAGTGVDASANPEIETEVQKPETESHHG